MQRAFDDFDASSAKHTSIPPLVKIAFVGKGRRPRSCPFGAKTGQALDRYLRVRGRHKHAKMPEVWLGDRGPLSTSGSARC